MGYTYVLDFMLYNYLKKKKRLKVLETVYFVETENFLLKIFIKKKKRS